MTYEPVGIEHRSISLNWVASTRMFMVNCVRVMLTRLTSFVTVSFKFRHGMLYAGERISFQKQSAELGPIFEWILSFIQSVFWSKDDKNALNESNRINRPMLVNKLFN